MSTDRKVTKVSVIHLQNLKLSHLDRDRVRPVYDRVGKCSDLEAQEPTTSILFLGWLIRDLFKE